MKFHKALALFNVHSETTYYLKNNLVKKVGICYTPIFDSWKVKKRLQAP